MQHTELNGFRQAIEKVVSDPATPDLSLRQMAVLLRVAQNEAPQPPSVRHLAGDLNLQKPSVTRAIDRLQEVGFVVSIKSPLDRRQIEVSATKAGRAYLTGLGKALKAA